MEREFPDIETFTDNSTANLESRHFTPSWNKGFTHCTNKCTIHMGIAHRDRCERSCSDTKCFFSDRCSTCVRVSVLSMVNLSFTANGILGLRPGREVQLRGDMHWSLLETIRPYAKTLSKRDKILEPRSNCPNQTLIEHRTISDLPSLRTFFWCFWPLIHLLGVKFRELLWCWEFLRLVSVTIWIEVKSNLIICNFPLCPMLWWCSKWILSTLRNTNLTMRINK